MTRHSRGFANIDSRVSSFSGHLFRPVERGKKTKPKNKRFGMQAARLIRACVVVCALVAAVGIATKAPAQGKLDLGLTTAAVRTPDMPLHVPKQYDWRSHRDDRCRTCVDHR